MNNYLTHRQVEILIKLYYLRKYTTAAGVLGITTSQVNPVNAEMKLQENAG